MKLQSLQIARGVAAMLVVLYHLTEFAWFKLRYVVAGDVFLFGLSGVDFFFVLSGLIITLTHADDLGRPRMLRAYALRRLTRIYPLLWVVTLVQLGTDALLRAREWPATLHDLVASFTLYPIPVQRIVLPVAWTLSHEMLFYALFALGIVLGRTVLVSLLALWAIAIATVRLPFPSVYLFAFLLQSRNVEFVLGCGAAVVVRRVRGGARWGGAVLALGLAWFAASALRVWFAGVTGASLPWLFALPSTAIVLGATLVERSRPWLAGRAVRWAVALGDASYVLYLIHLLVFDALYQCLRTMHALGWLPAPLVVSALLAGSLVAGLAVHRFVELPVTAAVRRWLGGERTRAPRDRRLLEELA